MDWMTWEQQFEHFVEHRLAESDPAHDIDHVRRVVTNAKVLATDENARLDVVIPAAWLHDCVVVPKDSPLRAQASREAARVAGEILERWNYPSDAIPAIQHAIEAHSFSAHIHPQTIEAKVVQDADRLDAIGAIGIARCLMLGGAIHRLLYDRVQPFPVARQADDSTYVVDHFFVKLFWIAETMQTDKGRAEAYARVAFMKQFLQQFGSEIGVPYEYQ